MKFAPRFILSALALTWLGNSGVNSVLAAESIAGGRTAERGQFPYQISLRMSGNHSCGGAIIGPKHIVTAANCIPPQYEWPSLTAATGAHYSRDDGQEHPIRTICVHPGYNGNSKLIKDDVAVITLSAPIQFTNLVHSLPLASRDYSNGGDQAIVSGWGKTSVNSGVSSVLKYLGVRMLSPSECKVHHSTSSGEMICTIKSSGQGECPGDRGGPLVINGELAGIVSEKILCDRGYPDVYTSILAYRAFIQKCTARIP